MDFKRLRQDLATGKLRKESIYLPGVLTPQAPAVRAPPAGDSSATYPPAPPTALPRGEVKKIKSATYNPYPSAHIQMALGFRIHRAIHAASKEGI